MLRSVTVPFTSSVAAGVLVPIPTLPPDSKMAEGSTVQNAVNYFYVGVDPPSLQYPTGRMVAIPVPAGETFPPLPASGIAGAAEALALPGSRIVAQGNIAAGPDPSTYAYVKSSVHANLFRIPLR